MTIEAASVAGAASAPSPALAPESPSPPWRSAGLWGGDVPSVAIDPRDPDFLLAGTAAGRIYGSRDGGDTWRLEAAPALFSGWVVAELLFDPNHSRRVWAALKGVWDQSGFVALSEDHGRTWSKRSSGLPDRQVYSLIAVPGTPGELYAGTRVGVFATRSHGRHWEHLTAARPDIEKVTSLLVDPDRPGTIWAGTWRRAYRSEDGGGTWERLDGGMALDSEVFSLLPVSGRPGEMWASTCGWVYRGSQHGDSWTRVTRGLTERRTPSFEILPSGRLLAGTVEGVFLSDDDGSSWSPAEGSSMVALTIAHHPARPDRVFVGSEGLGVLRSLDGGRSFRPASRGLAGLRVAGLARARSEVLAAVHHAHSASGLYSSRDGGLSFSSEPVALPTILDLAAAEGRVFAATEKGLFERSSDEWRQVPVLGDRRIDEVVSSADKLFVRSGREVFERRGAVFQKLDLQRIEPRRLALAGDTLWLTDRRGRVFRWPSTPASASETLATILTPPVAPWASGSEAVVENGASRARLLATGDSSWPLLLASESLPLTLVGSSSRERLALNVPLLPRDLAGALVLDGRLLIATTGFGVVVVELPRSAKPRIAVTSAR